MKWILAVWLLLTVANAQTPQQSQPSVAPLIATLETSQGQITNSGLPAVLSILGVVIVISCAAIIVAVIGKK